MNKIYKYNESFGRMGHLSGVFAADDAAVAKVMGKEVYLGEVLGKHSEIYTTINPEKVIVLSEDPTIIAFFEKHLNGGTGTNPVAVYFDSEQDVEPE